MIIENRKARTNYSIQEEFEFGIQLDTITLKKIISGTFNLINFHGWIKNGELWMRSQEQEIKLLAHKSEIKKIEKKIKEKKLSLIPLKIYSTGKFKVKMGLSKPLKNWERKTVKKEKDLRRELNFKF